MLCYDLRYVDNNHIRQTLLITAVNLVTRVIYVELFTVKNYNAVRTDNDFFFLFEKKNVKNRNTTILSF